ncbi:F0F1 ATP synthase subunit A [Pontibacter sp. G13]|uniref:F0F1 ATP synthase subunit A n=1 Tax=Pontibacter sp. G13 TaxID=3074898 RepID=UPI00288AD02D|nr:F0F1 ATP synthase subunit A [Pontibacter sp. G13]WNJ21394.1 F0F1 ATP synthase subunit A [Pontibacter sp. G13]
MSVKKVLLIVLFFLGSGFGFAQDHHDHEASHASTESAEGFNASEVILHHILDSHDWHITDLPGGGEISIHLPWMFHSSRDGFVFASGSEDLLHKGYLAYHDHIYPLKEGVEVHADDHGHVHIDNWEAWEQNNTDHEVSVLDFSFTKTSFQMLLIAIVVLLVFMAVAKGYQKNRGGAPKGIQSFFEPIIIFVRDEVAKNYLGDKAIAFTPYLLTLFFFIWFSNLFGLMPFNSNIAGNISVTVALSLLTFILIQVNGSKDYWAHIFWTPGIPFPMRFILIPVEVLGIFTKPFALAIRLFANITAGHFMVLGLISLIFIMGKAGANAVGGFSIAPLSVLFTIVIFCLEMIVAIVQAYIFTLLTAVFIGMAMESHDDHH